MRRWAFVPIVGIFLLAGSFGTSARAAQPKVDFNQDIRPLLSESCFQCHGPDQNKRKAELRLDTKDGAFLPRDGYATLVPGKPEESELYRRITADAEEERMPPKGFGHPLTPAQTALIKRWIEEGAEWKGHWSYIKPTRAESPAVDEPGFVRNEIDRFVLTKLRDRGMRPSPEADRVTLVRRLSLDLTGLPPAPQDVAAFVADQSPDAYEKLVDSLLASPAYGERLAMYWLDLVRYADTNGYHGDNHQDIDLFREYVIGAFNENKPFDRFTIEQLAGDLLPDATLANKVASGYNRLLMTTREGGAQAKEYMAKYAADRVRNASTVWLGATLGCAECHDHKFDPYSTKDFYSFASFFADIQEVAVGEQPQTPIFTPEESAQIDRLDPKIADVRKTLDTQTPELDAALAKWEQSQAQLRERWSVLVPVEAQSKEGATLQVGQDGQVRAQGASPATDVYTLTIKAPAKAFTALRIEALPDPDLPGSGPGRSPKGNFVLSELEASVDGKPVEWSAVSASHAQKDYPPAGAADGNPEGKKGWAIGDQFGQVNDIVFEPKSDIALGDDALLTVVLHHNYGESFTLGRFRLSATEASRPVRADETPAPIRSILAVPPAERAPKQKQDLATYHRSIAPELEAQRNMLADLTSQREAIVKASRKTLISVSVTPREMRILPRGNWLDDSGEIVTPGVPSFLAKLEVDGRASRMDLARWMLSEENPVVARVFVNRLWKLVFGEGLVRSLDDFGSQGTWPTHQQLLDWLAVDFREGGWNVKRTLKLMVMSGAYRQSSHADDAQRQQDPYNQWLARQNRFRLDAEMIRDSALASSGLLVSKLGGPSAKPYQPAGYWAHLNFPTREYQADHGDGLYRRGLYTYWARTFLHPSLKAFDAPTREECTVDRPRSNTPLQALVLLNDPTYVEAARVLAQRAIAEGGNDFESRLNFAWVRVLSRPARTDEVPVVRAIYDHHLAQFRADQSAADQLVRVGERPLPEGIDSGELAAWTSVARVLFNLHETITRN